MCPMLWPGWVALDLRRELGIAPQPSATAVVKHIHATQWYRAHDRLRERQCWGLQQWGLQRPSARQRRHPWVRIFYKKESWWGKVSNKGPLSWGSFFLFLRFYFFREGKGGRKRGRETSKCGCLSHAPYWGPGPQPKHMPWLGTDPLIRRPALNH